MSTSTPSSAGEGVPSFEGEASRELKSEGMVSDR